MRLKSMLIGSAAALVATGGAGAQAADVMMEEEMEPVEYVRVCDAYGSGFFYIPGSEICLRFDGYARYQINANEDQLSKSYRFRLNVDARSDTEWGTLRAFGRIQADGDPASEDAAFTADQLIIQLGGFHAGYTESAFVAPWGGLGIARFGVLHTGGGGNYAYQQRNQIGYTWAGADGFSVTVALEDDDGTGDGHTPDVAGVIGFSQAWGGIWAKGGYDESASEATVTAGVQINVPNAPGSSFRAAGFYSSDPNSYSSDDPATGEHTEWSVAASYKHQFTPAFSGVLAGQYFEGFDSENAYQIQGAVVWAPIPDQMDIRLEGYYTDSIAMRRKTKTARGTASCGSSATSDRPTRPTGGTRRAIAGFFVFAEGERPCRRHEPSVNTETSCGIFSYTECESRDGSTSREVSGAETGTIGRAA